MPTTVAEPTNTIEAPATTTPALVRPGNPTNLRFTGREIVQSGNPGTYNVFFAWDPSPTKGVKYCVDTTSFGSDEVSPDCSLNNPYLITESSTGIGLVFEEGTTYKFQVTAVDSNNLKSDTIYLEWRLP